MATPLLSDSVCATACAKAIDDAFADWSDDRREEMIAKLKAHNICSFQSLYTVLEADAAAASTTAGKRWLRKLQPAFQFLEILIKLGRVVSVELKMPQYGLPIIGLCWILSKTYRSYKGALESIDGLIDQLHNQYAKFANYINKVKRLSAEFYVYLGNYFKEIVLFFGDCIEFLEQPKFMQVVGGVVNSLEEKAKPRLPRLAAMVEELGDSIDRSIALKAVDIQLTIAARLADLCDQGASPSTQAVRWPVSLSKFDVNKQFFYTAEYQKLHAQALRKDATDVILIPVCGAEGTGKTTIVRQFIAENYSSFDYVACFDATTAESLKQAIYKEAISSMAVRDDESLGIDAICSKFLYRLESDSSLLKVPGAKFVKWMLVFDDVKDISVVQNYFLRHCQGTIVVVLRDSNVRKAEQLARQATPVFLQPLSEEVSVRYLRNRVKTSGYYAEKIEIDAATTIAKASHGFIACLEVLAKAADSKGSFKLYMDRNRNWMQSIHAGPTAIFASSIKDLALADELLLRTISFMHIEAVPLAAFSRVGRAPRSTDHEDLHKKKDYRPSRVFINMCEYPGREDVNGEEISQSVDRLQNLGLVETYNQAKDEISVNSMVVEYLLNSMDDTDLQLAFNRCVMCLNAHIPSIQDRLYLYGVWDQFALLANQVRAVICSYEKLRDRLTEAPVYLCAVIRRFARYLYETAQYSESRRLTQMAIDILSKALGAHNHPTHPEQSVRTLQASLHANLGHIFQDLGIMNFGIDKHVTEYNICEKPDLEDRQLLGWEARLLLGPRYQAPLAGPCYQAKHSLGTALMAKQEYSRALTTFDIDNKDLVELGYPSARDILDFGICHRLQGNLPQARKYIDDARARFSGREFDDVEFSDRLVAACDFQDGLLELSHGAAKSSSSMDQLDRTYALIKSTVDCYGKYAKGHPYMAFMLHKLATVLIAQGKHKEASDLLIVVVDILGVSEAHQVSYIRSAALLSETFGRLGDKIFAARYKLLCEQKKALIEADKKLSGELAYKLPNTFESSAWKDHVPADYR